MKLINADKYKKDIEHYRNTICYQRNVTMDDCMRILDKQEDVLDKIRAEIEAIDTVKVKLCDCMNIIKSPQRIKDEVLGIIDKYKAESEGMDRKTLGEDICECGHHFPKGKYDFCPICGSEFGIIDRYRNEVSS